MVSSMFAESGVVMWFIFRIGIDCVWCQVMEANCYQHIYHKQLQCLDPCHDVHYIPPHYLPVTQQPGQAIYHLFPKHSRDYPICCENSGSQVFSTLMGVAIAGVCWQATYLVLKLQWEKESSITNQQWNWYDPLLSSRMLVHIQIHNNNLKTSVRHQTVAGVLRAGKFLS